MPHQPKHSPWHIFLVFLRLGLTSFGGPIAHLGYFRETFVTRRRWLSDQDYADLVALCQFLPGPASSQVGIGIGLSQAGYAGAFAAWAGFTLPSAFILILFAHSLAYDPLILPSGVLHGLKIVAVAVVAQAVLGMARHLCTDTPRRLIMLLAAATALLLPSLWGQIGALLIGGTAGAVFLPPQSGNSIALTPSTLNTTPQDISVRRTGKYALGLFLLLLATLPLLAHYSPVPSLALIDTFYRAGALVFGGGHVVLPLLQAEIVIPGWVNQETFLAGYGAAQAIPGPLFTFAAFLGASIQTSLPGWLNGVICLLAIFTPSFLLVAGVLPYWNHVRKHKGIQTILAGANAAVVGLLAAALYHPVASSALQQPQDAILALAGIAALMRWKCPPWLVVAASGLAGWGLDRLLPPVL